MSKENSLSVLEREFILEALLQNIRLDGRRLDAFRPLSVTFGEEYGHVKIQLGQTRYSHPMLYYIKLLLIVPRSLLVWLCVYPPKYRNPAMTAKAMALS